MRIETVLSAFAQSQPEKPAILCAGQRLSYGELDASARRLASGLAALGVRPGDRVVLYLPNGIEFVKVLFASLGVGAVVVPVNTRLTAKELGYFGQDCRPAVVAYHSESRATFELARAGFDGAHRLVVGEVREGEQGLAQLERTGPAPLPLLPCDDDDCMIMYTSGTTGRPKGALITHANLLVQHRFLNALDWDIGRDDRFLVTTPLAHRTGLARMLNAITLGGTLSMLPTFDAAAVVDTIERDGVTVLGMVPTVARMLLPVIEERPSRCSSLRHIVVTGEAFPVELKRKLLSLLPDARLASFFAMTEAGSVTSLGHEEQFTHPGSVGRPTPGVQVRFLDENGRDVAPGEVGELLVRCGAPGQYTVMKGYYRRADDTRAALVDGWLHTGDMARQDGDGYLYIVDRKKDMVLSGGFNIYTREVEQALCAHPAVSQAAVVGVPDEIFGEAVAAFVELHPGAEVSAQELVDHCKAIIASYKKPKYVHFVQSLPRNAVGKVLKSDLRARALERLPSRAVE